MTVEFRSMPDQTLSDMKLRIRNSERTEEFVTGVMGFTVTGRGLFERMKFGGGSGKNDAASATGRHEPGPQC